ncbi:hypothetical protein ARSQ2_01438 [Arsenophonus endosymbiont of Bemisia tabaci Q2]|nr:hypothetical protein ARSQ2_01438 [Arsenophonus endosymbiont of Bemisia tabaci Q2]
MIMPMAEKQPHKMVLHGDSRIDIAKRLNFDYTPY